MDNVTDIKNRRITRPALRYEDDCWVDWAIGAFVTKGMKLCESCGGTGLNLAHRACIDCDGEGEVVDEEWIG